MIGKIKGKVDHIYKNALIIDINGIGYKVNVNSRLFSKYSQKGSEVDIYIHTYVREDDISLFGFESLKELSLFENLLSISGIGARTSLSVLSSGTVEQVTRAVVNADIDYFINIPGIGKKSAQRLIVDLKSVLGDETEFDVFEADRPEYKETLDALKQFGFRQSESRKVLRDIKNKNKMKTEELIKEALRRLAR